MKLNLKNLALALLTFFAFAFGASAQTVKLKTGSKLVYGVNFKGQKYDFTVTIKKMSPEVVFEYEMTAPANKKGKVTIPAADMDSARELYNYFSGGSVTMNGQTSVFLSRKVFDEVINEMDTHFKPNTNEPMTTFGGAIRGKTAFTINGKKMEVETEDFFDHYDSASGYHYFFTVLRNKDIPLITHMDLGWSITLKEMKNVDFVEKEE